MVCLWSSPCFLFSQGENCLCSECFILVGLALIFLNGILLLEEWFPKRAHYVSVYSMDCGAGRGRGELHPGPGSVWGVPRAHQPFCARGGRSWASPFGDGYFPYKWLTPLSSQLRSSHQVSFSSPSVLLYLIEAFLPLPALLTFGSGSRSTFCREQLSSLWLLSSFSSSYSSPGRTELVPDLLVGLEGPSMYRELLVVEKGKKQRTGSSISAVTATGWVKLRVKVHQLSVWLVFCTIIRFLGVPMQIFYVLFVEICVFFL